MTATEEKEETQHDPTLAVRAWAALMQLMPDTASERNVENVHDPEQNLNAGAAYLASLIDRYKELPLALAAYNAGSDAVDKSKGIPNFKETKDYVKRVMRKYKNLQRERAFTEQGTAALAGPHSPAE